MTLENGHAAKLVIAKIVEKLDELKNMNNYHSTPLNKANSIKEDLCLKKMKRIYLERSSSGEAKITKI